MTAGTSLSRALQRVLLAVVLLAALFFEGAYLVNMVQWRNAPDRGWTMATDTGPKVVALTRPAAEQAGMRVGDHVLSINGQSYQSFGELLDLLDLEIGSRNVYWLERDGEEVAVSIPTERFGMAAVLRQSGPYFLIGVVLLAMGWLVYAMKPYHGPSWAFLALATALGITVPFMVRTAAFHPSWLERVPAPLTFLVGAALFHLAAFFPRRWSFFERRWWLALVPYAVALALAVPASRVPLVEASGWERSARYLFATGALLAFVVSTGVAYLRGRSVAERLQAVVVLTGSVIALALPFGDQIFSIAFSFRLVGDPLLFTTFALGAFPLSIGYAIARHDLFEVDVIVRRTYGYLLSTTAVVALYGSTVATLNLTIGPSGFTQSPFFTVGFVLIVVFLMQPLQARIQAFVDRVFYRRRYDYARTITEATEQITSLLDPELVRTTLVQVVVREMFLENGMLLAADEDDRFEVQVLLGQAAELEMGSTVALSKPLLEALRERRVAVFRHELELSPRYEGCRDEMRASFDALEAELMLPMLYQDQLRAVLSIGRKKSGQMFRREDVDLLRTLLAQSAVALENARLFDDLAGSLKEVQLLEAVKSNLAKFVPRTVQDLIEGSPDADGVFEKRERDLTVMFADMVGYTRLSAQLPPDQVNAIVERYFGAFLDEILRLGGDVNETAGDGLMVLFQDEDPNAHARAAVAAAVAIQRITREINAERPGQPEIQMHIGVNSGTASVGATKIQGGAAMRWTYTASGPVTNIAARVGALGEAIAVTGETRRRLGPSFRAESLGLRELKNVSEPVEAFRILGETETSGRPEGGAAEAGPPPGVDIERPDEFVITGVLRETESGAPLAGLLVRAFDRDLVVDDYLGSAESDALGYFRIAFTEEFFAGPFDEQPDIYLRIFTGDGETELASTRHEVRWDAGTEEHFELSIPAARLAGRG